MLATPVETVPRDRAGIADLDRIRGIAEEEGAFEVIVGLPLNLRGDRTLSTEDAEAFALLLARSFAPSGVPVRLVDERLSTVSAQGQLRQAGKRTKQSRSIIDQAAAVVILQHALDMERSRGEAAGTVVEAPSAPPTHDASATPATDNTPDQEETSA